MGFLDMFIEKTDEPVKQEATKNAPPKLGAPSPMFDSGAVTSSVTPVTPLVPTVTANSDDTQKFMQHFDELFDQANLPGPDYYEFAKMCQAMSALPDDTKFTAAFSGLQVQGLTKIKLLESAQHYIAIIDEDAAKFNTAIDQKILADVKQKRDNIEKKKKALSDKVQLIAQLQAELANDNNEIATLTSDADEQERKATEKGAIYKQACQMKKDQISGDLNKINTHIK
jgi:predicted transcriptional regulator